MARVRIPVNRIEDPHTRRALEELERETNRHEVQINYFIESATQQHGPPLFNEKLLARSTVDANTLGGLSPSRFLRSDANDFYGNPLVSPGNILTTISNTTLDIDGTLDLTDATIIGVSGSIDHGALGGLSGYDHDQYLTSDLSDNYTNGTLTFDVGTTLEVLGTLDISSASSILYPSPGPFIRKDGTIAMTGNLDMGGQNLINADAMFVKKGTGVADEGIHFDDTLGWADSGQVSMYGTLVGGTQLGVTIRSVVGGVPTYAGIADKAAGHMELYLLNTGCGVSIGPNVATPIARYTAIGLDHTPTAAATYTVDLDDAMQIIDDSVTPRSRTLLDVYWNETGVKSGNLFTVRDGDGTYFGVAAGDIAGFNSGGVNAFRGETSLEMVMAGGNKWIFDTDDSIIGPVFEVRSGGNWRGEIGGSAAFLEPLALRDGPDDDVRINFEALTNTGVILFDDDEEEFVLDKDLRVLGAATPAFPTMWVGPSGAAVQVLTFGMDATVAAQVTFGSAPNKTINYSLNSTDTIIDMKGNAIIQGNEGPVLIKTYSGAFDVQIDATAGQKLDVLCNARHQGYVDYPEQSVPADPSTNVRRLFVDDGTGELSVRTSLGETISLEGTPVPFATQVDEVGSTTYIGEAVAGSATSSAVWRIKKMVETGPDISLTWADGNTSQDNIWDNRASLSYS